MSFSIERSGAPAAEAPVALALAEDAEAHRIAEERELSLLYVGCTRARESLLITFSGQASRYLSRGVSPDDA